MFVFTVFVVFAVAYGSPNPQEITIKDVVKAYKSCVTNFPPELKDVIDQVKSTGKLPENPSEDFKCFILCTGKELGIVDEKGGYHFERLKKTTLEMMNYSMSTDEAHKIVEECISVEHDHECERAHLFVQCHHPKVKDYEIHEELKGV